MKEKFELHISAWSIIKVILILVAFYFIYFVRDIIALLFIVLILVAALLPIVDRWEKKIDRRLAIVAVAVIILALLGAIIYLIVPPFATQFSQFISSFPNAISRFSFFSSHKDAISSSLEKMTGSITNSFVAITASVFGGVVTFLTAIVLTVYMLLDSKKLSKTTLSLIPIEKRQFTQELAGKLSTKVGGWVRGQISLGFIIAIVDLVGLLIIGIPYALPLAVVSGLLEVVPTIGPIISGVLAALIALSVSPLKALFVVILYIIVQQLENNLIVPKVMQKAVGLPPVIIILAIITGAKLMGVIGAILAVPICASLFVLVQEWHQLKKVFSSD